MILVDYDTWHRGAFQCCRSCHAVFAADEPWRLHRVCVLIDGEEQEGCLVRDALLDLGWEEKPDGTWEPPYVE